MTGTNDQPEITQVATTKWSDAFTEASATTGSAATRTALGSVTFLDVDASDMHTATASAPIVTWTKDGGTTASLGPIGSIALNLTETAPNTQPVLEIAANGTVARPVAVVGQVGWTYTVADGALDFLAAGEKLELVYTITIRDDSDTPVASGTNEQDLITKQVTVTITGTNDVPVITGASNPGSIAELVGDSSNQDIAPVTGTITVIDPDHTDFLTLSVIGNATATYTPEGGEAGAVPIEDSVDIAALIASGAISFQTVGTSNGLSQTVNWTYDPAAADLDWLRAGDTLTITYVAQINDGHGNVGAQNLVIKITGTNDNPYISGSTGPAPILEVLGDSSGQDIAPAHGTITFTGATDQDLGDTLVLSVICNATAKYNGGTVPGENSIVITNLIASGAISFATLGPSNGESQTVNWTYNPAAADLDWLREGDTLTITYIAQIDDGHGTLDTEPLVITITGTNDVPVITGATRPGVDCRIWGQQRGAGHRGRHRHDHRLGPGRRRYDEPERDRQCDGELQWRNCRCVATRRQQRRRIDRQRRHQLRDDGCFQWREPDRQLDVRPGGGRSRLAASRRHADPDLSRADQ